MRKKHQRPPIHVYPPFPSFAWVMTTQANPPSQAYAYGYVQSVHAHNGTHPHPHPRLPAHRHAARARYRPHSCSTRTSLSSPPVMRTKAAATAYDEKLMKTVDYRFHDPPSRPYVPWHEGYTLRERGAQQPHHRHHRHHTHHRHPHAPPAAFAMAAAPSRAKTPTPPSPPPLLPAAVNVDSKRRFPGGSDDDDEEAFVRRKKTTTVDVVKIKRFDIMLSALCRACKLSKIAAKGSGGEPSILT